MQLRGNWNYPTSVRFGAGHIAELPDAVRSAGMKRPLLVTDPRLAVMPMVQDALGALEASGIPCAVFSDVRPNPVAANVEAGVSALKSGGHDGVVAFGGGSAIGGRAPIQMASRRSWRCRPRPGPARRWAAPESSRTRARIRKR